MAQSLPPGQVEVAGFPRFGAHLRRPPPPVPSHPQVEVCAAGGDPFVLTPADLATLPRHEVRATFSCVAGWSTPGLAWVGVRFADVYDELLAPRLAPAGAPSYVVARGGDGWRATALLHDLRLDDVLLADQLDGEPLSAEHGAPLRLVSPAQYGFLSVKHLCRLTLVDEDPGWPRRMRVLSPHPRARVGREERRADVPGVVARQVYRPLVPLFMRMVGAGDDGRVVRGARRP